MPPAVWVTVPVIPPVVGVMIEPEPPGSLRSPSRRGQSPGSAAGRGNDRAALVGLGDNLGVGVRGLGPHAQVAAAGVVGRIDENRGKVAAGLVPVAGTAGTGPPLVVVSVAVVAVLVMTPMRTPLASGAPNTPSEVMVMSRGAVEGRCRR